jgi:hypothetical protein
MSLTAQLGTANSRLANIRLGGSSGPATYNVSASDTLTFTEVMQGVLILIRDTLVLSEVMTVHTVLNFPLAESITFTDAAYNIKLGSASDTLTFTDGFTRLRTVTALPSDTLVFSDNPSVQLLAQRSIFDALNYAELAARTMIRSLAATDTVTFSATTSGYVPKIVTETLTLTDSFVALFSKGVHDLLSLDDLMGSNAVLRRSAASLLELFDAIQLQILARRAISETITFTGAMTGYGVKPISQLLTLVDSVSYTISKLAADTLSFTDSTSYFKTLRVSDADTIVFTDTMTPLVVINKTIAETLSLSSAFVAIRARFFSASDTLSFSETVYREIREALAPDVLTLSEAWTRQKIGNRSISESLVFTDTMNVHATLRRAAVDSLSLVDRMYAVVADQFMVFIGQSRAVVISPPEFNDYEGDRAQVIFKRKMGGSVTTYVKTTRDQKIHYEFVVPRPKANELREFLDEENGRQFTIYDWKGQVWIAKLSTDTVEKTEVGRWEPCGNKTRVALEFIGARYA